jgi:hypothetical protein
LNFQKKFGTPETVIIAFGDWEQRQQMKYKEPTKGKGMRSLFRKCGYKTYLVDEFRSSCKCSQCNGGDCKKFLMVDNPKPYRNNQKLCWGLLKCKICSTFWNRDCNGAKNIYKIAENAVKQISRPDYLCRKTSQVIFKNGYNQNLYGYEKTQP